MGYLYDCRADLIGDVEGLMSKRPLLLQSSTRKLFSAAKPNKAASKRIHKKKKELARRAALANAGAMVVHTGLK